MKFECQIHCGVDKQCTIEISNTNDGGNPLARAMEESIRLPCFLNVDNNYYLQRLLQNGWNKTTCEFKKIA